MAGWALRCLAVLFLVPFCSGFLAAEIVESDGPGNIRSLTAGGRRVPIVSDLVMPSRGWTTTAHSRWNATLLEYTNRPDGRETWRGRVSAGSGGPAFDYTQTRWVENGRIRFQAQVTSRTSQAIEGVFLFLTFPVSFFGGGEARFFSGSTVLQSRALPAVYQVTYLSTVTAGGFTLEDAEDRYHFALALSRPYSLTLQDNRQWGDSNYALFFALHSGNLASGQSAAMDVTIEFSGTPDTSPVTIAIDPAGTGDRFDGWGGNFVFNSHVPEVDWLLSELRVAWARAEVNLRRWEPENDNASSTSINWDYFEDRLKDSETVQDFEIARKLKSRGIPVILSVWYLPDWLQPGRDGSKVPPENWNELLECIGSYLLTARNRYGFEADYFSFNEPDLGVYLLQSPSEHRDAVKSIGQYLQSLGLKTKLLIGDCANASNPAYVEPLAADPEALQYAGPVAYHSWNGSSPENYRRWREIATSLGRPLLVTEVGSDPGAWHYPSIFWTYGYALDDLANYFGFLTHSRPQGALQWELTSDYPLVRRNPDGTFSPSQRFWFVKHLANLTPPGAEYLEAVSPSEDVGILAFRGSDSGAPAEATGVSGDRWVIHLANFGPARVVHLTGFPVEAGWFQAYRTSSGESMRLLEPLEVERGVVSVELAAQSLTSLVGIEEASVLRFAHFAQGGNLLSSRVLLLNPDAGRPVSASVHFRGWNGAPLDLPLSGGEVASGTLLEIPPLGLRTLETSAAGPVTAGSATVIADAPLSGSVLFGGPVGLAGVASGALLEGTFQVPVEVDVGRRVNTGLALAGQSGLAAVATLELLAPDGTVLASAQVELAPWGHSARFVDEYDWEPPVSLDSFTGTIRVRVERPVVATVLQTRPGEFLTLPVATAGGPASPFYFAQFGEGEGLLSSRIAIVNAGDETASGALWLRAASGEPLVVDLNGQEVSGTLDFVVPPGGLATFTTDGSGPVQAGSVEVAADQSLTGVLLFTGPAGAAGVGMSPSLQGGFLLPVERREGTGSNTGVAIHNLAGHRVQVRYRLRDLNGGLLAEAEDPLEARGHNARFVTEIFRESSVELADFLGVLEVRLEAPAAAVGLLSRPGQLATLPVTPLLPEAVAVAHPGSNHGN
ncbi:MAG: hypothetical protein Kow001_09550 [Acidobacteriota bacterium]